jgi:hypothetical protein
MQQRNPSTCAGISDTRPSQKDAKDGAPSLVVVSGEIRSVGHPPQEDKFHQMVTKQGLGYHEMVEVAVQILQGVGY